MKLTYTNNSLVIIEILNHINGVLNANIGVYIGDCHTTSKIAAAMSYISYQVIAAGRTKTKPVALTKSKEEKIKANLELLNKAGCRQEAASPIALMATPPFGVILLRNTPRVTFAW